MAIFIGIEIEGYSQVSGASSLSVPQWKKPALSLSCTEQRLVSKNLCHDKT